jgi:Fic family protein
MASVQKRLRNGIPYFYLIHSIRQGKRVDKKEVFLGDRIPKNIEMIKKDFLHQLYEEYWFVDFDRIREGYLSHKSCIPSSALKKEIGEFGTRFTYNTNRIEGSTLTLRETADLLERGISPGSRFTWELKEAEAHRDAYNEILDYKKDLSFETVLYFHRKLFSETKKDIAGSFRDHQVAISGSRYMPPLPVEIYPLMKEVFKWYRRGKEKTHPVELAGLVQLKLLTIHPFSDGNGRISRLMMNLVLNKHGYPMLDIPYTKRGSYYSALERTQTKGDDHIFLIWFFKRYKGENLKYLQ